MPEIRPSFPGTWHTAVRSGVAVGTGVGVCVEEGIGVLVDVGESLIVGVGGSITPVVGVAVRREADSPTNELFVHAATTTMMQNSNIISLNEVIATSSS